MDPDPELGRIVLNQGVDGVVFKDDSATVVRKLGRPNRWWRNGPTNLVLIYDQGPHAMLYMDIDLTETPHAGFYRMDLMPPYEGKTSNGIGLGSTREEAWSKLGKPTLAEETSFGWRDTYYSGGVFTYFEYEGGVVSHVRMDGWGVGGSASQTAPWIVYPDRTARSKSSGQFGVINSGQVIPTNDIDMNLGKTSGAIARAIVNPANGTQDVDI
ncbi:MAG: hypothetical protein NTU47_14155 [Ignavibacteriales bacterium]|nr:hypothetical protein [Ignavibacteriales bacterium]